MEPNKEQSKKAQDLNKTLDEYLNKEGQESNMDCSSGVCVIKGDKRMLFFSTTTKTCTN